MEYEDELVDELMELVAAEIEISGETAWSNERLLSWIRADVRSGSSGAQRADDDAKATAFARRMSSNLAAQRADNMLPLRKLHNRTAPIVTTVAAALRYASSHRCATILDLAVAAGSGRELWDEPCEQWLELPPDIAPSDRYIALRVAGESMSPILEPRDVILVKLDGTPATNDLVVARVADQGYVVKRVSAIRNGTLQLSSFNPLYKSISMTRHRSSILGTVIARFRHE